MEEVIFRNEFDHSYMLVKMDIQEKEEFPFRMIVQNNIPGFLPCKLRFLEETAYYAYDITSKKSLQKEYSDRKLGFNDLKELFYGINRIMKNANEFLLPLEGFLLEPHSIFMDLETESYYCLYLPALLQQKCQNEKGRYREFADFLLDKTDHKDEHAVNVAYQFYKMSKEEFFSFEVFVGFMEKEELLLQAEVRKREEKRKEPVMDTETPLPSEAEYTSLIVSEKEDNEDAAQKWWIPSVLFFMGIFMVGVYLLVPLLRHFALYILLPGFGLVGMAAVISMYMLYEKLRRREEDSWKEPSEPVSVEEYFDDLLDGETVFFDNELSFCLKWREGHFSKAYHLTELPVTVGKMKESVQLYIEDVSISRLHAQFKGQGNVIVLQDLDSTNGTVVNGKRLAAGEEIVIKRNDEIQFGKIIVNVV